MNTDVQQRSAHGAGIVTEPSPLGEVGYIFLAGNLTTDYHSKKKRVSKLVVHSRAGGHFVGIKVDSASRSEMLDFVRLDLYMRILAARTHLLVGTERELFNRQRRTSMTEEALYICQSS